MLWKIIFFSDSNVCWKCKKIPNAVCALGKSSLSKRSRLKIKSHCNNYWRHCRVCFLYRPLEMHRFPIELEWPLHRILCRWPSTRDVSCPAQRFENLIETETQPPDSYEFVILADEINLFWRSGRDTLCIFASLCYHYHLNVEYGRSTIQYPAAALWPHYLHTQNTSPWTYPYIYFDVCGTLNTSPRTHPYIYN